MHHKRLAEADERGRVDRSSLEPGRVRVVVAASGRNLQARAPAEPGWTEEREIAYPETACREGAVQPLVAEGHDRVRSKILDVDTHLAERLRRVDDRDRADLARDAARFASRQHVARLARHERDHERPRAVARATAYFLEEAARVAMPPDLAQLVTELGAPPQGVERAPVLLERREN